MSDPKSRRRNNQEVRDLAAAEKRAAIVQHTADVKRKIRDAAPMVIFWALSYLLFAFVILRDAKTHPERADQNWLIFIIVSVSLFGNFMVRHVLGWKGRL